MRRVVLSVMALTLTALVASEGAAGAALLGVKTRCDKYQNCSDVVSYTADRGERNDMRLISQGGTVAVVDGGAVIHGPEICSGSGSPHLTCTLPFGRSAALIAVDSGDGDDRLDASAPSNRTPTRLDGGSGNDILVGGPFEDVLTGGGGDDVLNGGGARDMAAFGDRRFGVRVDLRAGRALRPGGERDRLVSIESVRGGRGDDVLIGDGGVNGLTGGGGNDDLRGRGGRDDLTGDGRLNGGPGNDELRLVDRGRATCGAGSHDVATAAGLRSIVDDSCEGLRLPGLPNVGLHLAHRDPSRDFITIPVLGLQVGDILGARLTARARHTVLGTLQRRISCQGHCPQPRLRFSPAGAAHVRRSAPLHVVFSLRARRTRTYAGGTVQLRINRH